MGQQQLILLVLATVIVGVAIVVGIRAFTENSAKSNADAMTQEAVRIANDMQAWKKKPAPFGGQGATQNATVVGADNNFTGFDWPLVGLTENGAGNYETLNGEFVVSDIGANPLITGTNTVEGNIIQVRLCGMRDADITGGITQLAEETTGFSGAPACPTTTP